MYVRVVEGLERNFSKIQERMDCNQFYFVFYFMYILLKLATWSQRQAFTDITSVNIIYVYIYILDIRWNLAFWNLFVFWFVIPVFKSYSVKFFTAAVFNLYWKHFKLTAKLFLYQRKECWIFIESVLFCSVCFLDIYVVSPPSHCLSCQMSAVSYQM